MQLPPPAAPCPGSFSGILRPDGSRVEIDGRDPFADRERHVALAAAFGGWRIGLSRCASTGI